VTGYRFKPIQNVCDIEIVSPNRKDTSIIPLLIRKGNRKRCGNYRGISLLSVVFFPHTIKSAKCPYFSKSTPRILMGFQKWKKSNRLDFFSWSKCKRSA